MVAKLRGSALEAVRAALAEADAEASAGNVEGAIFAVLRAGGRLAIEHGMHTGAPVCRRYEATVRQARATLALLPPRGQSIIRDDRKARADREVRRTVGAP